MGNGISYKRKKKEKQKLRKKCYNKVIGETCGLMIWYDSLFFKKNWHDVTINRYKEANTNL